MKYLDGSFSVNPGASDAYRENYDRTFGKKDKTPAPPKQESWEKCPVCGVGHFCNAEKGEP